ncbi:MAG: rhodanese-like domain-containing protein [Pseudomonadota bacterium]
MGAPDLSALGRQPILLEWRAYPGMAVNTGFVDTLIAQIGPNSDPLLFICRSGARSLEAARAVAAKLEALGRSGSCINVAEGFEGDLDADGHRGNVGGWKARGLAWRQS